MPEEMILFLLGWITAQQLINYSQTPMLLHFRKFTDEKKIKNLPAVVTVIACIFIEVITDVKASVTV